MSASTTKTKQNKKKKRERGRRGKECADLVERPSVTVVEDLHALDEDRLGLLARKRVLAALDGLSE